MSEQAQVTETAAGTIAERLKDAGDGQWVVMSEDGKQQLSKPMSQEAAQQRLGQIEYCKKQGAKESLGLALDVAAGTVSRVAGGRYVLSEDAGDLARMSDDDLRSTRSAFITKRTALRQAQAELADTDRYGSPAGAALLDDKYYYDMLISRLESEMACRLITLD